jgi:hypothetical protein
MNTKTLLGVSFAATFALIAFTPLVSAVSDIFNATVTPDGDALDVYVNATSKINKGGQDGAFGYGVLTDDADGATLNVATTHAGVLDSEKQSGQFDPVWHTHAVTLTEASEDYCDPNPNVSLPALEVASLSYEEPGKVKVKSQTDLYMENMPDEFSGTNPLDGFASETWTPGNNALAVVQFTLNPVDNDGNTTLEFDHVCVENITAYALP